LICVDEANQDEDEESEDGEDDDDIENDEEEAQDYAISRSHICSIELYANSITRPRIH